MYDETIDVVNAAEVKSPQDSDSDSPPVKETMSGSKKPQGLRSKLMNAYDLSDSDTPEPERFINDLPQRTVRFIHTIQITLIFVFIECLYDSVSR